MIFFEDNDMIKIYNASGTDKECYKHQPQKYSSWIDAWEQVSGYEASICAAGDCIEDATDGCHVRTVYGDNRLYIVPLCKGCNHRTDKFKVPSRYLIPLKKIRES